MPEARVASIHDLADGQMKTVEVDGIEVLLARVNGRYHACGARCPHVGAPLAEGVLHDGVVVCPWHHARFDVTTGALCDPPALDRLPRYTVRVDGEDVYVRVDSEAEPEAFLESPARSPVRTRHDGREDPRTFVILGGGAAGQAAAEALREAGFAGRVLLVSRETHAPYDRTQLSKGFLAGKVSAEALPLRRPDFYERFGIELLLGREVVQVDAPARTLRFADGEELTFDAALLAPGGAPRRPDVPGADLPGVVTLRSRTDAEALFAATESARRVAIVGSGFIGMEAAASLRARGTEVTVVTMETVPFEATLGREVGEVFQRLHEANGVTFRTGERVARFEQDAAALAVVTASGARVEADVVLLGLGIVPETAAVQGVEKADDGGLVADEHLRVAEHVYAAGDAVHVPDPASGRLVRIEHWRVAQQHGRVAAFNMAGRPTPYRGVPFFWTGQFGAGLRYVGHASRWDEVVIDGDLAARRFVAYYVEDGQVRAAAGIGRDRDLAALHALLLAGQRPTAEEVRRGFRPEAALAG